MGAFQGNDRPFRSEMRSRLGGRNTVIARVWQRLVVKGAFQGAIARSIRGS